MASPKFDAEIAAKGVARSSMAATRLSSLLRGGADVVCPYPRHRSTDWQRRGGGPVVCGVCHPPAAGVPFDRIGDVA